MSELYAYIDKTLTFDPIASGDLDKMVFAVKDVFDLKGVISSAGNPVWLKTHEPASDHAHSIKQLLTKGATLKGTTITDELMYSLNGENVHYGTPVNPRLPGHIPGGSSSGSASVVAGGDVDFSIGTDTGGSVRIPAAYCGIYGIRPTHGAVSIEGLIPLAQSFDTVGWMSKEADTLEKVGNILLPAIDQDTVFTKVLFPEDVWQLAESESIQKLKPLFQNIEQNVKTTETIQLAPDELQDWKETFRIVQAYEVWANHGQWVQQNHPQFGPGIAERFVMAKTITKDMYEQALKDLKNVKEKMRILLEQGTLLVIPTVPGPAPEIGLPEEQIEQRRSQTLQLSCIAGLAGLPQVTIPLQTDEGPIGLSLIAGANHDLRLLRFVNQLTGK